MHGNEFVTRNVCLIHSSLLFIWVWFIVWSLALIVAELYQDEIFLGTYDLNKVKTYLTFLAGVNQRNLNELVLQLILILKQYLYLLFPLDTKVIYGIILALFVAIQGWILKLHGEVIVANLSLEFYELLSFLTKGIIKHNEKPTSSWLTADSRANERNSTLSNSSGASTFSSPWICHICYPRFHDGRGAMRTSLSSSPSGLPCIHPSP